MRRRYYPDKDTINELIGTDATLYILIEQDGEFIFISNTYNIRITTPDYKDKSDYYNLTINKNNIIWNIPKEYLGDENFINNGGKIIRQALTSLKYANYSLNLACYG